jgi:hypothetical protein
MGRFHSSGKERFVSRLSPSSLPPVVELRSTTG